MRGIWRQRWSDDAGMTLIEIVVAAVILFIILTGVLGLIGQTTQMSAQAKEITVANNAVAAYVEWVRSLKFDKVGVSGETSGGVLPSVTTTTTGEYTITIEPDVDEGENASIKELTMHVTVTRADGLTKSFTTTVIVRDKDQFITQTNTDPALAPRVSFVSPTPPADSVAYDSYYIDSAGVPRSLSIGVTAEALWDHRIEQVTIWCDDTYVIEDISKGRADWILTDPVTEWTLTPYFTWYTRQTQTRIDVNGVPYETEVIADGQRSLVVYARDNVGAVSYQTRRILVDNYPPDTPQPPVATVKTATLADIDWPPAADGTGIAHRYHLHLYQQKSAAEYTADPSTYWKKLTFPTENPDTTQSDAYRFDWAQPLSRYYMTVRAYSPRGLASANRGEMVTAFVTRPRLTGTYAVTKSGNDYTTTANLSVTAPTFKTAEPPSYTWRWRSTDGAVTGSEVTSASTLSKSFTRSKGVYQMEFWVDVTYKSADTSHGGGVAETRTSNKVGPTPASVTSTTSFTEGVWTW